ncbi:hypothetical protein RUM44_007069 [Polyplax serrata]|uniref:Uncharacterized protein n=1 Tax=Polyplax serrata TaxID=468196 RepID=A0ABR1B060_POLSC
MDLRIGEKQFRVLEYWTGSSEHIVHVLKMSGLPIAFTSIPREAVTRVPRQRRNTSGAPEAV